MEYKNLADSPLTSFVDDGLISLPKFLARYELYKKIISIPGDIVEGGVFNGSGVLLWAALTQIFNPLSRRRIIGFDYFDQDFTLSPNAMILNNAYDTNTVGTFSDQNEGKTIRSIDEIMKEAKLLSLEDRIELVEGDAITYRTVPSNKSGKKIIIF